MQAKSDSNYVAVTRHRKFIGSNQFISSCPPILRATASDRSQPLHLTHNISTRLDDDDIWFSSMASLGASGVASNYHSTTTATSAGTDFGDSGNDGTNIAATAGGGGNDDLISPHSSNPMIMESSEDITAVAPHSSVSAIVSYNERRRREDGWNDLGLETILRTNASTNGNALLMMSASNVVPFSSSSSDGGGGGGEDDSGAATSTQQQQRSTATNNNDDD